MGVARIKSDVGRKFSACVVDNFETGKKERFEVFREFWVSVPDYAVEQIKKQEGSDIYLFEDVVPNLRDERDKATALSKQVKPEVPEEVKKAKITVKKPVKKAKKK